MVSAHATADRATLHLGSSEVRMMMKQIVCVVLACAVAQTFDAGSSSPFDVGYVPPRRGVRPAGPDALGSDASNWVTRTKRRVQRIFERDPQPQRDNVPEVPSDPTEDCDALHAQHKSMSQIISQQKHQLQTGARVVAASNEDTADCVRRGKLMRTRLSERLEEEEQHERTMAELGGALAQAEQDIEDYQRQAGLISRALAQPRQQRLETAV